ncbi:MAG TPA: endonuclease/exonuclease/phosphatase family protein [Kofleriaceae bacterium]
MLRLATFNVENLFELPCAMALETWEEGQPAIDAAHELNTLFEHSTYSSDDKQRMLELLEAQGLLATRPNNPYLELQKIRGQLFVCPTHGAPSIVADGRDSWVGWVELKKQPIDDQATVNTARVIAEVNADVLVLVEVEDRIALQRFHDAFVAPELEKLGHEPYPYNMVIDGNDPRGIDVGILSRKPLTRMQTHLTDTIGGKKIFSRDCPEYYVSIGDGKDSLVVLPNHFSSKGSDKTGKRRAVQAQRVREIYDSLRAAGHDFVVVAGDFNDFPGSGALDALLKHTDLTDAMLTDKYHGAFPGTYQRGTEKDKIDYLLLSPDLTARLTAVDVNRHGFYAPTKWKSFDNINARTKNRFQASDHHCVWADIDI